MAAKRWVCLLAVLLLLWGPPNAKTTPAISREFGVERHDVLVAGHRALALLPAAPARDASHPWNQQLAWQRNAALEEGFYRAVKETFGIDAMVATHPTWWPNPDLREFKKNGLDWWSARRDLAQTDEVTPFCVRTALTAGNLGRFHSGGVELELDPPLDLALWRDDQGRTRGVVQGNRGPLPASLLRLTSRWLELQPPAPLAGGP